MNEAKFWKILEYAKEQSKGDLSEQSRLIATTLAELEVKEILEFDAIYAEKDVLCYSWDLVEAARLLMQGCSDDSFIDFRDWLISQGEAIFYKAVQDPDCLAHVVDLEANKFRYDEQIIFNSIEWAYELKIGEEEMPPRTKTFKYELKGEECKFEELENKYPKLASISKKWYGDWLKKRPW